MTIVATTAVVGETVQLVAKVLNAAENEGAKFEILIGDETIDTLGATVEEGVARASWTVDVGGRSTPVDVVFTASVRGQEGTSGQLRVESGVAVGAFGWVKPDEQEVAFVASSFVDAPPTTSTPSAADAARLEEEGDTPPEMTHTHDLERLIAVGDVASLRLEVGNDAGGPVREPFDVTFTRHEVAPDGTVDDAVLEEQTFSFAPTSGARAVLFDWKAKTKGDASFERSAFKAKAGPKSGKGGSSQSPPATVAKRVTIRIVGELPEGTAPPGLFDRAKQATKDWKGTLVITEFPTANTRLGHPVRPDGTVSFVPPAKKGVVSAVLSENVDVFGTLWTIRDAAGNIPASKLEVAAGSETDLKISSRVRVSVNATAASMEGNPDFASLDHQFDDLTLLNTVTNTAFANGTIEVQWDPRGDTPPVRTHAQSVAFYRKIIDRFHAAGIQVLLGMHQASNDSAGVIGGEFKKWMKHVVGLPPEARAAEISAFVDKIYAFLFGPQGVLPDADGFSFDIEHVPSKEEVPIDRQVDFFTRLYRTMAAKLYPSRKFVVVYVGQFAASSQERTLADLDAAFHSAFSMTFTRAHPYTIAKGVPNLILRPMAFGKLSNANTEARLLAWYREIVAYALDFHGLHPSQFQVLLFRGDVPATGPFVKQVCEEIMRPNRVGISPFGHDKESWSVYRGYEAVLNPGEKPPDTRGQPVQYPVRQKP